MKRHSNKHRQYLRVAHRSLIKFSVNAGYSVLLVKGWSFFVSVSANSSNSSLVLALKLRPELSVTTPSPPKVVSSAIWRSDSFCLFNFSSAEISSSSCSFNRLSRSSLSLLWKTSVQQTQSLSRRDYPLLSLQFFPAGASFWALFWEVPRASPPSACFHPPRPPNSPKHAQLHHESSPGWGQTNCSICSQNHMTNLNIFLLVLAFPLVGGYRGGCDYLGLEVVIICKS